MKQTAEMPLAGIGVLVTRPAHQAGSLAEIIRRLGGEAVLFPALAIEPIVQAPAGVRRLARFDYAIFVSPNAARIGMKLIEAAGDMPAHLRVAAIGPATAAELEKFGLKKDGPKAIITGPAGFDSEALLKVLPQKQVAGRQIAIFRGEGGRELLGETLRSRDAEVEYIECYRRVRPDGDMHALLPRWRRGEIGATIATSAEIVANLFGMAGEPGLCWVRRTPMFVPHPRVAAAAFKYGTEELMVTGAGDEALAAGIETWFGRVRPEHAATPAS